MEGEFGKKMDIIGVICEYDPFHLGHQHQLNRIRAQYPEGRIVCLMSGCFTQRGMPALFSPAFRAETALRAGADMVLELPAAYAIRDGEHFALGGVSLLNALGFVNVLSFGAEDAPETLWSVARLLEAPDEGFTAALKQALSEGVSHATAQGKALSSCLPEAAAAIAKPNNILAICYLRAILRLKSSLVPYVVRRESDYHSDVLTDGTLPSATAIRAALIHGDDAAAQRACGYDPPAAPRCLPDALDKVLLHKLRCATPSQLKALPYCGEGLENRLSAAARAATTREELLAQLKTRRYTRARLSRLCCHALLDVTADGLAAFPTPPYARLLGFREKAGDLLKLLGQSRLPIISKAADGDRTHPLYRLDMRAYDLWALGAGLPAGYMLRSPVAIIPQRRDIH